MATTAPKSPSQGGTTEKKVEQQQTLLSQAEQYKDKVIKSDIGQKVSNFAKDIFRAGNDSQQELGFRVEEIGKPFFFTDRADPQNRTYNFLATRMNVLDLYPCNYAQAFLYNTDSQRSLFRYGVAYQQAMKKYKKMCEDYLHVANPPSALRLYLTDDTTSTDGVSTTYKDNFFQTAANAISNKMQGLSSLMASTNSTKMFEGIDKAMDSFNGQDVANNITSSIGNFTGLNVPKGVTDMLGNVVNTMKDGVAIALKGNKLSLPKIWDNSNYRPTFSISTRLFSPYGSPSAVKEYIIKPLTYLLLLASPQSDDMVSYGKPFAVTVRSWGTGFITLGGITSLTLQRGGADTVYNIYKQPLIINVNMNFESLADGLIAFGTNKTTPIPQYEGNSFSTIDQILPLGETESIDGSELDTVVPTVGSIIRSMQPVNISGLTTMYNEIKNTREDVMVGGNPSEHTMLSLSETIMSGKNGVLDYASVNAGKQSGFGESLLGGLASTFGAISTTVGAVVGSINQTVGTAHQLANLVTLGQYSKTSLAKTTGQYLNQMNQMTNVIHATSNSINIVNNSINRSQQQSGSLTNLRV